MLKRLDTDSCILVLKAEQKVHQHRCAMYEVVKLQRELEAEQKVAAKAYADLVQAQTALLSLLPPGCPFLVIELPYEVSGVEPEYRIICDPSIYGTTGTAHNWSSIALAFQELKKTIDPIDPFREKWITAINKYETLLKSSMVVNYVV